MTNVCVTMLQTVVDQQIQVVPVIAQAGTALAPLVAVGVTSLFGLLLKPRELLRVLRAKPWILAILVAIGAAGWWSWQWFTAPPSTVRPTAAGTTSTVGVGTDWSKVALEIIRQRAQAPRSPATMPSTVPEAPASSEPMPEKPAVSVQSPASTARIFRGDDLRSGYLGGPVPSSLQPRWRYRPQDDPFTMILSSPMVHSGKVYGASCLLEGAGSYGTVFCLDATTGKEIWLADTLVAAQGTTFMGFFSSPALTADGTSLVIGQGLHTSFNSHLVCLNAATGALRWSVPTPLHVESSPAIEGDLVVVGVGAVEQGKDHRPSGDAATTGNPGFVLGVRISTGAVVFRAQVNDPEGSPVLRDGICYIGSGVNGNRVVALRTGTDAELAASGQARELWSFATPFPATGAVTVTDAAVLIGCGAGDFVTTVANPEGRVFALDRRSGALLWQADLPDAVLGAIAVHASAAYVPCRNGEVFALDLAQQGAVRWRARVNGKAPVLAGPACTATRVFAVSNDGWMTVLDAADGKQVQRIWINDAARPGSLNLSTSSPLLSDGLLYVGSETGGLQCFAGAP